MRTLFFAAIAATFCFFSCQEKPAPKMTEMDEDILEEILKESTIIHISPKELDSLRRIDPNIPVIDVRPEADFLISHIFRAMNCFENSPDFEKRILQLSTQSPVIIYDMNSSLSLLAANKMKRLGFMQIYELEGGLARCIKEGKVLVSGKSNIDSNTILK